MSLFHLICLFDSHVLMKSKWSARMEVSYQWPSWWMDTPPQVFKYLLSMVNSMIDYYLLSHLHTTPVSQPFNIGLLVSEVCQKMAKNARANVTSELVLDPTIPSLVITDPNFIKHFLKCLLSNAFRFTHVGNVYVSVKWTEDAKMPEKGIFIISLSC